MFRVRQERAQLENNGYLFEILSKSSRLSIIVYLEISLKFIYSIVAAYNLLNISDLSILSQ